VLDRSLPRLRYLDDVFGDVFNTGYSSAGLLAEHLAQADMVIGAVLIPGAEAPKLVRRAQFADMKPGAVLVDVAIDQGGCFETSKATTHGDPTFTIDGVVHYCVANMPGAVPKTSTWALTNATLPYAVQIASQGWKQAAANDPAILSGLNVVDGKVVYKGVCDAFGLPHTPVAELF